MKLLTSIVLTLLLFVVAFAGLSPPTEKQNRQTFHAMTARPPLIAEQAVQVEHVALAYSKQNLVCRDIIGVNPYKCHVQTEVRPVARNGSHANGTNDLTPNRSHSASERDIGSVLLL